MGSTRTRVVGMIINTTGILTSHTHTHTHTHTQNGKWCRTVRKDQDHWALDSQCIGINTPGARLGTHRSTMIVPLVWYQLPPGKVQLGFALSMGLSYFKWSPLKVVPQTICSRIDGPPGPSVAAALGPLLPHSVPLFSTYTSKAAQHKDTITNYISPYASLLSTVHVLCSRLPQLME